jgi:serine/threonine protein kinase
MAFEIGSTVGDYQIIAALGAGGMGKVYKVRNVISDRIEAMKILLPDLATEPELADRFVREIKVLASLNHPNIAALHTALRIENQLVMIMELVEGVTLEERLRQGPIPLTETLRYIDQVLAALSYAHARGIIHRDIKPANMMLTAVGVVKLMDFGIAKPAGDRRLTMTGTTMGSLYYMPPEQVKSETIDARADLYSLGVSLYELVTGRRPFQGDSNYAIMAAHLQQQPVPPMEVAPGLPRGLNDLILMALAKDPGQRFQSADAFRAALSSVSSSLGSITPVAPATPPEPVGVSSASMLASSPEPLTSASVATLPQPSVSNPVVAPPPAVAKSGAGHRGLYMALGAAVVIVIVALTAMELPKTLRKRSPANSGSAPVSVPAAPASSPQETGQPASPSAISTPTTQSPPQSAPANAPEAESRQATHQAAETAGAAATVSSPAQTAVSKSLTARRLKERAATPAESGSGQGTAAQANPLVSSAPPAPSGSAAQTENLQKLNDRMTLLAARANAVKSSLENLERQQQSQGLSLRGDIAASLSRMEAYMDASDKALSAANAESAGRNMDLAEREIDRLEKFLGR